MEKLGKLTAVIVNICRIIVLVLLAMTLLRAWSGDLTINIRKGNILTQFHGKNVAPYENIRIDGHIDSSINGVVDVDAAVETY